MEGTHTHKKFHTWHLRVICSFFYLLVPPMFMPVSCCPTVFSFAWLSNQTHLLSFLSALKCFISVHRRNEIFATLHPALAGYAAFVQLCSLESKIIRAHSVHFCRQGKRKFRNVLVQAEHNNAYLIALWTCLQASCIDVTVLDTSMAIGALQRAELTNGKQEFY